MYNFKDNIYMTKKQAIILASGYVIGMLIVACDRYLASLAGSSRYMFTLAGYLIQLVSAGTIGLINWRKVNVDIARREKQEGAEAEIAEKQIEELLAARSVAGPTS